MDFDDFMDLIPIILVVGYVAFMIGLITGIPTELDDGCIVRNGKIYCEIDNKGAEKK